MGSIASNFGRAEPVKTQKANVPVPNVLGECTWVNVPVPGRCTYANVPSRRNFALVQRAAWSIPISRGGTPLWTSWGLLHSSLYSPYL